MNDPARKERAKHAIMAPQSTRRSARLAHVLRLGEKHLA